MTLTRGQRILIVGAPGRAPSFEAVVGPGTTDEYVHALEPYPRWINGKIVTDHGSSIGSFEIALVKEASK